MRKLLCACVVLVLAVAIAGCGGSGGNNQPAGPGGSGSSKTYAELRWGVPIFPSPIYGVDNGYYQADLIEQLAVQNLEEFEPSGKVKAGLASSVEHPSPTTYIYNLRPGVKFSDGKPLTVADVVFSLDHNIYGKESAVKLQWEDVASVTARGSSAVVVKLKRPNAAWPQIMAFTSQIIEKAAAERVGEKAVGTPSGLPIGTGPWKLDSYKPEVNVELSPNPYWKGAQRPAKKINISIFKEESAMALALRTGAIDGAFWYVAQKLFRNIPGTRQLTAPGATLAFFSMNVDLPPFNDVHLRRAIAYAADVKGMINSQVPGLASEDITVAPTNLFYTGLGSSSEVSSMLGTLPSYAFDLAAAKRELAKSAYPHGVNITVQAIAAESSMVLDAEILISDLAKIGIKAKLEELTVAEFTSLVGSKLKLLVAEYAASYPDAGSLPPYMLASSEIGTTTLGFNVANYKNPEVDKLLAEQSETANPSARLQVLGKLLKVAGTEVPYRPLYTHKTWMALSDKYVYPTFSQWTFNFTPWALDVKLAH